MAAATRALARAAGGAVSATFREEKTSGMAPALFSYVAAHVREPDVLKRIRAETEEKHSGWSMMLISADEAAMLGFMASTIGARRCIEVGTFTGMSSTAVALNLPADGKLVACDVSEEWTSIAAKYWKEAGVEDKIDLRLAPALETLDGLLAAGEEGSYDMAFIDADKTGYDAYYERCLKLLRVGGVVGIDNVLWHGKVADEAVSDEDTVAIRALNDKLVADDRVQMCMVPIGDGVTFARKL